MKKITFIRHSKLAPPFDNYDKLSYQTFRELALGEISPSIHPNSVDFVRQKFTDKQLKDTQIILHSGSSRTIQTAQLIKDTFKLEVPLQESSLLHEVVFDPKNFVSEDIFLSEGLPAIRRGFYPSLANGNITENIQLLNDRFEKLVSLLRELPQDEILCVSHGFVMVLLNKFFKKQNHLLTEDIQIVDPTTPSFEYLTGFVYEKLDRAYTIR